MQILKAKVNGKVVHEWELPSRPEEITHRQKIMFAYAYENFINQPKPEGIELLKAYCKVIAAFFDTEVEEVLKMPANAYDSFEKSMTGLFLYILGVMHKYVPRVRTNKGQDHHFTYKGENWTIPWAVNASDVDVTFGQAIELLEIERKAEAEKQERDDLDNIAYSSDLFKLAVLAKKEGEELPDGDIAIQRLMRERAEHFQDVDMVTMGDCLFFLSLGASKSLSKKVSNGSSTLRVKDYLLRSRLKNTISERVRAN